MIDFAGEINNYKHLNENGENGERNAEYNCVLDRMKVGGYDIAQLELKSLIRNYGDFCEARILLGLCYMVAERYEDAYKELEMVVRHQPVGIIALKYIDCMVQDGINVGDIGKGYTSLIKNRDLNLDMLPRTQKEKRIYLPAGMVTGTWAKYVAVFIVGFVAAFFISMFIFSQQPEDTAQQPDGTGSGTVSTGDEAELRAELVRKNEELSELQTNYDLTAGDRDYYKKAVLLYEAAGLFAIDETDKALTQLGTLKGVIFREKETNMVKSLCDKYVVSTLAAKAESGMNLYFAEKYDEALAALNTAILCADLYSAAEAPAGSDKAIYYYAKCCEKKGDTATAQTFFERLTDGYPEDNEYVKKISETKN